MVYKVLRQFQNKVIVKEDTDYVFQSTQITHSITLNSATDPQDDLSKYFIPLKRFLFFYLICLFLDYYVRDIDYEANERLYFQSVYKKVLKYQIKNCYNSYNSDGDADDEEESGEETY